MRNQQPDNFFRERLADYQKPAPAGAWDRIETSLKKTETKFAWWKVAASLLLLTSIGYILWLQSSESNKQPIAQTQSEIESPKVKPIAPKTDPSGKSQRSEEATTEKASTTTNATGKKSVRSEEHTSELQSQSNLV